MQPAPFENIGVNGSYTLSMGKTDIQTYIYTKTINNGKKRNQWDPTDYDHGKAF